MNGTNENMNEHDCVEEISLSFVGCLRNPNLNF